MDTPEHYFMLLNREPRPYYPMQWPWVIELLYICISCGIKTQADKAHILSSKVFQRQRQKHCENTKNAKNNPRDLLTFQTFDQRPWVNNWHAYNLGVLFQAYNGKPNISFDRFWTKIGSNARYIKIVNMTPLWNSNLSNQFSLLSAPHLPPLSPAPYHWLICHPVLEFFNLKKRKLYNKNVVSQDKFYTAHVSSSCDWLKLKGVMKVKVYQ